MKKAFLLLVLAIFGTTWAGAKITLPTFFSDNMVLQQNTEAAIWGRLIRLEIFLSQPHGQE